MLLCRKNKIISVSSMNTLLAILKVTDARRDVILAGGLNHRFRWRDTSPPLPPPPPPYPGMLACSRSSDRGDSAKKCEQKKQH